MVWAAWRARREHVEKRLAWVIDVWEWRSGALRCGKQHPGLRRSQIETHGLGSKSRFRMEHEEHSAGNGVELTR